SLSKKTVSNISKKYLNQEITVDRIFYVFPNVVILKNVVIREEISSPEDTPIVIPTVVTTFSPKDSFVKRRMSFSKIVLYHVNMNYPRFCKFLKDDLNKIVSILRKLPKGDIEFSVKNAILDLSQTENQKESFAVDLELKFKGDSLLGNGSFRKDTRYLLTKNRQKEEKLVKGDPLKYYFSSKFGIGHRLDIDRLVVRKENFLGNFWGYFEKGFLELNGFSFVNTLGRDRGYENPGSYNLWQRVKAVAKKFQKSSKNELPNSNVYLLDMATKMQIDVEKINLHYLDFTLNNIPVNVRGQIAFSAPVALNLFFTFNPPPAEKKQARRFERAELKIMGFLKDDAFKSDGFLTFNLKGAEGKENVALERIEIDFRNLALFFDQYNRLNLSLGEGDTGWWTSGNEHRIYLQKLRASLNFLNERFKLVEFHSPFYEGFLEGKLWFDTGKIPPRINIHAFMEDVNANKLDQLLIHFLKIEGRLFSEWNFRNYPDIDFSGYLNIENGYLKNFEFFKWLANSFSLPSLERMPFDKATADFVVNREEAGLPNISVDSKDTQIKGFFTINKGSLVSSKLSLIFSRDLLMESPKFRSVLKLFEKETPSLTFDFQLSGNQHGMNFQWTDSEVKEKIQNWIPDFIERRIERRIDDNLDTPDDDEISTDKENE
ncbi:MAG: hypothetical protein KAJ19_27455, partial [Gammaproteobacteria bacterium]|nr:hypothetical protein [Gammaproteobacteria bacterium]